MTAKEVKIVVESEDDFGHELRVGNIFATIQEKLSPLTDGRSAANQTQVEHLQHGGTYTDPVTSKPRQFDYRCRMFKGTPGQEWSRHILMALECKNVDTDSPVVICGRHRTLDESFHDIIEVSEKTTIKRAFAGKSFYSTNAFVGKSIIRIKNNGGKYSASRESESEIYDKWSQALASSHGIAFGSIYGRDYVQLPPYSLAFVMPVVVVPDGALWMANYKDSGTLIGEPSQINQCAYYIEHKLLLAMILVQTHIHFVTLKGLSELLNDLLTSETSWNKIFSNPALPSPHNT